jgi:hypothetical protein
MSLLSVRVLNETDYEEILTKWWKDWNWDAPSKDFLPDNGKGGVIVFDGDIPVCAGFMYATNSKAAWIDWIISSKEYRVKPNRKVAISLLIEVLTEAAKDAGFTYCYALIKSKPLIETYKQHGYLQGDSYTSEMIKKL